MRQLMSDAGLTPPTFESDRERNQFVVTFLFHHFLTPEDWAWLGRFGDAGLSDEEARALVFVRELGAIDNAAYRNLNRVDVLNASQHLRRLRDFGLLQQKGKSAVTYYVPTEKLLAPWRSSATSSPSASGRPGTETQSGNPVAQSGNSPTQSGNPEIQSGSLSAEASERVPRLAAAPGLPAELAASITNLKARVAQPEMEDLVWRLCAWKEFSTEELAQLLQRNRNYVQDRLITPMLRAGRLEMTIPDQPNHPEQRYRSISQSP